MALGRIVGSLPGQKTEREGLANQVWWAMSSWPGIYLSSSGVKIASGTVDSGNTPTTTLRGGNIMARVLSTELYGIYDPDANNGLQIPLGILPEAQEMLDDGTATATFGPPLIRAGGIKESEVIGLDANARAILKDGGILWDDEVEAPAASGIRPVVNIPDDTVAKTVVAAENGIRFIANDPDALTTFTLPTIANGLSYDFLQTEDQNLVIVSAAGNDIIAFADVAASTLTYSGTQKIGSLARLTAQFVEISGTNTLRWVLENLGGTTVAPT